MLETFAVQVPLWCGLLLQQAKFWANQKTHNLHGFDRGLRLFLRRRLAWVADVYRIVVEQQEPVADGFQIRTGRNCQPQEHFEVVDGAEDGICC